MKKKVVWLPYDFDTAIGINNEGALVFDYSLEDTDLTSTGAEVYNGQDSVLWNNIRMAFSKELAEMYKTLRSTGVLSYAKVEKMFEDHQSKWPENIFNEDAWFKYILPLVEDGTNYLDMLQGSKAEQRKWWLYNRFRYIDSKYNAGDALSSYIALRAYARGNAGITVTPYADIYPTIKFGSYLVSERGKRNIASTIEMPSDLTTLNDTEVYIYSAPQIADIGDISGMQIGLCDVSMAINLQGLKIGDADPGFSNSNLYALTLGNNRLLKTLDVRNCVGLGDTSMQGHTQSTVDLSGCSIIENVYFDGTSIAGVTLPNGGVLRVLHLPATTTNLTILNQNGITDLTVASYNNISTLRLENVPTLDTKEILQAVPSSARVRLIGFYWDCEDTDEIRYLVYKLDQMRGLDENGNNTDKAQAFGTIHVPTLTGAEVVEFTENYPDISFESDHLSCKLRYHIGSDVIYTETVMDGGDGTYAEEAPREPDAQYMYEFIGWSKDYDDNTVDRGALGQVTRDRDVYACYNLTIKTYTITWVSNGTVLRTDTNIEYGTIPYWGTDMPISGGTTATGWDYDFEVGIVGDTTIEAIYVPFYTVRFYNGSTLLYSKAVIEGRSLDYKGEIPTSPTGDPFLFWDPEPINVMSDLKCYATYTVEMVEPDLKYLTYTVNAATNTMTITAIRTDLIVSDGLTKLIIPDTIQGYRVVLA